MSDVNANIDINIDGSQALAEIKRLQREISLFYTSINKGSASAAQAAANMQKNLVNSINATGDFTAQIKTIQTTSESFTTSLEKNKFSMREYFRYGAASTKTFGKLFKSEFNTIEKTAIDRVKKLQTQYIKLGRDANGAMKAIAVTPTNLNLQDTATKTMIAAQKQQIFNQLLKQGSTNLLNFGKNTQWAGRQLMVGFTVPLTIFGSTAAKAFMELEEAVVKFKRVYGDMYTDSADTDRMIGDLQRLAKEYTKYGIAVVDTMNLAAEAAAMGKQGADLTAQVAEATRLAVLGGVEQSQALETTTSLTNAFGVATQDLASNIDFLNAVENQTVTSIEDLTIAIPKAGPVVQQLGGDVKDLAFFLTAMKEGGINASEGANALKSGLASLINPTAKASEFMQSLGINITGIVERNKGNLQATVVEFATALDKLDPLNRARAIEQLFGKFQFARLSTLFQNVISGGSQAAQVLDLTKNSVEELAILSERELGAVEDSVGKQFTGAMQRLQNEIAPIGKQFLEAVTPIVEFVSGLIERFNGLSDGVKRTITIIIGVLGAVGPAALMAFGLLANGLANIIKFIVTLRNGYQKLTGQSKYLGEQTQYMTNEQIEAAAVAASLDQAHANLTQRFTSEAEAVEKLVAAYQRANAAGKAYAGANPGSMLPPKRGRYATGVVSVPGPKGAGDIVPAMLSPGEAVIPAKMAEKYAPLIKGMISGNLPGYQNGLVPQDIMSQAQSRNASSSTVAFLEKIFREVERTQDATLKAELEKVVRETVQGAKKLTENVLREATRELRSAYNKNIGSASTNANTRTEFAHVGEGITMTASQLQQSGKVVSGGRIAKDLEFLSRVSPDTKVSVKSGLGFNLRGDLNNQMGGAGADLLETITDFRNQGVGKWKKSVQIAGGDFQALSGELEQYDRLIAEGLEKAIQGGAKFVVDTNAQIDELELAAKNAGEPFDRNLYAAMDTIEGEARANIRSMGGALTQVIDAAEGTITEIRVWVDKQTQEILNKLYAAENDGAVFLTKSGGSGLGNSGTNRYRTKGGIGFLKEMVNAPEANVQQAAMQQQKALLEQKKMLSAKTQKELGLTAEEITKIFMQFPEDVRNQITAKGKSEFTKNFKQAAEDYAEQIALGASEVLQTNSPSKRMHQIGVDAGQGFINGAESTVDDARNAGSQMASQSRQNAMRTYGKETPGAIDKSLRRNREKLRRDIARSSRETQRQLALQQQETIAQQQLTNQTRQEAITETEQSNIQKKTLREKVRLWNANRKQAAAAEKNALSEQAAAPRKSMIGRLGGVAAGASTALMVGSMMPGKVGEMSQKLMGPVMALTMILPMLTSAAGAAALAIGLIVGAAIAVRMAFDSAQDSAMKMTSAIGATNDNIKSLGEFTKKVSASEIMQRRRQDSFNVYNVAAGKTTFGANYVKSTDGKQLTKNMAEAIQGMGLAEAQKQLTSQLATSVVAGVVTTEQARSIALSLGEKLGNYSLGLNVAGKLSSILGPNGENLLRDPLEVRMKLIQDTRENVANTVGTLAKPSQQQLANESRFKGMSFGAGLAGGAAAGALVGSAVPVIGTAIGAVIGGIVGGTAGLIYGQKETAERKGQASGAIVATQKMQMEQSQQLIDSLDLEYQKRIEAARLAGDMVEYERLQNELIEKRTELLKANSGNIKDAIQVYKDNAGELGDELMTGVEKAITKTFKGTAMEDVVPAVTQSVTDAALAGNISQEQEYAIKLQLSTGNLDPLALNTLMGMVANKETGQAVMDIITNLGAGGATDAAMVMGMFVNKNGEPNKELQADFLMNIKGKSTKEATEYIGFFKDVAKVGGIVNADAVVSYYMENPDEAENLQGIMDKLEANKGKLTLKLIGETDGMDKVAAALDNEYFNSLDQEQRYVYTTTIATMLNIPDPILQESADFKNWLASGDAFPAGGSAYSSNQIPMAAKISAYREALGQQVTQAATVTALGDDDATKTPNTGGSGGGGAKDDPYEDILNKLKQVRDAAINAAGGLKELLRVAGQGKNIKIFQGMNQQLTRKGYGQDFVDAIMSMDKETRDKFAKIEKGTIKLTAAGKALAKAYKEVSLGELSVSMTRNITDSNNQIKAFNKLKKAGFDTAKAYELLQDTNLAAAVAGQKVFTSNGKLTAEFKRLKQQIDNATKAMLKWKLASMEGAIDVASQGVSAANSQFDTYTKMVQSSINLSVIPLPTADEGNRESLIQMQSLYAQMQANSESIADNNRLIADTQNEISGIQSDINAKQREMASIQRMVEINFDRPIKDMQDRISQLQRDIELQFTRPIEELQETINDMQRASELKFDRPMKALQDESTRLSNDLAIMDNAAEEINKKYEAQAEALNKVAEANQYLLNLEKQRVSLADALTQGDIAAAAQAAQEMRAANAQQAMDQANAVLESSKQAELDALRSESGMTREEIAKRQYEIGQQTYELEQQKKIVDEQILAIQDQIYNLQEQQELKQSAIRDIEDQIYQLEQARKPYLEQIEAIQESIALIELNSLQPLQDKLDGYSKLNEQLQYSNDKLQFEYDQLAENLTVQGKTQKEWQNIDAAIAAANITTSAHLTAIKNTKKALEAIVDLWNKLKNIGNIGLTVSQVIQTVNAQGTALVAKGGLIPEYLANGGSPMFKPVGTDTVPAMLTPGEFVVRKAAVDKFGIGNLMAINSGKFGADAFKSADFSIEEFKTGNLKGMVSHTENNNSVYNYAITVNGGSSMSADDIANTVISKIKTIDSYRVRSQGV